MNKATAPVSTTSGTRQANSAVAQGSPRTSSNRNAAPGAFFIQGTHKNDSPLEQALAAFLRALEGKNRSSATIRAYQTDVAQFLDWLHQNNAVIQTPDKVEKADVGEY